MTTNNAINSSHNGVSGSGSFVGDTNATLVTPILGTPTSGTLTHCTGLPLTGGGVTGIIAAANLLPFGSNNTKVITFTNNLATTGTQTITGVGFTPSLVIFYATTSGATFSFSIGFDNGSTPQNIHQANTLVFFNTNPSGTSIILNITGTDYVYANITSFNSDGFVITWSKGGSPTGTAGVVALCFQ
jgi:hypothetical protein